MPKRFSKKRVVDEVNLWMERLGMVGSWHVDVDFSERTSKRNNSVATIECAPAREGYRAARLTIYSPVWLEQSERTRTLTLIHELRHCHYANLDGTVSRYVGADSVVAKALDEQIEALCESDAMYFYRLFRRKRSSPLP